MSVWKRRRPLQILITSKPKFCGSRGNGMLPNRWPKLKTLQTFAGMNHTWIGVRPPLLLSTPLPSSPLSCPPRPSPALPAMRLEVIITVASGFISIYSHNNTEKWQTDGPGVMYYPLRESSFIMTTSSASSLCQHPFSPFFFSSLSPPSTPLLPLNPWRSSACKFVPHYHKLW